MTRDNRHVLAAALLIAAACADADGAQEVQPTDRVAVRTAPVAAITSAPPVTGTGTLAAREETPLGFAVGGVVARVLVREGDAVRRGQPLAELDLREVESRLVKARAAQAKAERDLARVRALYADSVAPRQQLDDAATALDLARADVEAATYARRYATIVAPGDGAVLQRLAEPGQVVSAGAAVLVVGNRAAGTVLRVGLPDRDVVRVRDGDAATVRFDAHPGRTYTGRVTTVAAAASGGTGTYAVEIRLDGAAALPSGLVGRASIAAGAGAQAAWLVPASAVLEADGDRGTVFALAADTSAAGDAALARARRVPVTLGALRDDGVAVLAGLAGVERVVTDGAGALTDGAAVRIVP